MRTVLSETPSPGALTCPVCDLYTTKRPYTLALKQLGSQVAKGHRDYQWTRRYCNGPTHRHPALLPLTAFNRRGRQDDWRRECRDCEHAKRAARINRPNVGWIPVAPVRPFARRLIAETGTIAAAAEAAGVADGTIRRIEERSFMRRDIAARILIAAKKAR